RKDFLSASSSPLWGLATRSLPLPKCSRRRFARPACPVLLLHHTNWSANRSPPPAPRERHSLAPPSLDGICRFQLDKNQCRVRGRTLRSWRTSPDSSG